MSVQSSPDNTTSRHVGGTEYSWCRAVPGGTGVTVLSLLFSKPPDLRLLHSAIHKLHTSHPVLRSKLRFNPITNTFSFFVPPNPSPSDSSSISSNIHTSDLPHSFYQTIEHEMNSNPWANVNTVNHNQNDGNESQNDQVTETVTETETGTDVMFTSVYSLPDEQWAVVVRLHTAVCDRAAAAYMCRELVELISGGGGGGREIVKEELGLGLPIEECIPAGKGNKPFWARGADMIGYGVNAFRFCNLEIKESGFPNSTKLVRLKIGGDDTERILSGCKSKGVKLSMLLAAAGFIAARASKDLPDKKWEKYSLATLIDCRSLLDPVLSDHHIGFYHSAILTSHDVKGGEDLWDLAKRIYTSFTTSKNKNKHFTDMADLNFLMCKAIENPGLTPSSSLRTSLLSVFEEPLIETANQSYKEIGLVDYIGCASVHGVSPSLAIFNSIRDGELDCACVHPSPTHSKEQMQDFVDHMKKILIDYGVARLEIL